MPRSRLATRLKIVEGGYELFYKQGFARVQSGRHCGERGDHKADTVRAL